MENYIFRSMNSEICLQGLSAELNQEIHELFNTLQALLSRFDAASDVCLLNSSVGSWQIVHPLTFAVLSDACTAFVETDGLYNPFLGNILAAGGYDKSFEQLHPSADTPSYIRHRHSFTTNQLLDFDHANMRVRLADAAAIDLGGYAKGWAAQLAFQYLLGRGCSQGLIDAGGDIIGWGRDWEIDISHPLGDNKIIASIHNEGVCAIATSNTIYRRWRNSDQTVSHHIIDPRSLQAANSDLIQVSIIADNLTKAEQFTKCMLILGVEDGISWLEQHWPHIGYILVTTHGQILTKSRQQLAK